SLKQHTDTCWNSELEMLESVSSQFEDIYNLLLDQDELEKN
ncbi:11628_t:CDS:1, partial [Entrophospora sp. SA101]